MVLVNFKPYCSEALGREQRAIVVLRDCGALLSLASESNLHHAEYAHTGEFRLIQGIVGQAVSVALIEILIELNGN